MLTHPKQTLQKYSACIAGSENLRLYIKQSDITIKKDSIVIGSIFAQALLKELANNAANNGKPFTSFQIKNIERKKPKYTNWQILQMSEDTTRYINKIIVEGYKKMPIAYLKRFANFKTGSVFNQNLLREQQNTLNTLPFVKSKKDLEVQFTQDQHQHIPIPGKRAKHESL